MSIRSDNPNFCLRFCTIFFLLPSLVPSLALNPDGVLLLSFKNSVLSDPFSMLQNWNYNDETPCSWNGVLCTPVHTEWSRVISLVLPNNQLSGSIPSELGMIENLRHLDLSNNFFIGSLPIALFNASKLTTLDLSHNVISGEVPELVVEMKNLQSLNLSNNALSGTIPRNISSLPNLTVLSLSKNRFSGSVPNEFEAVQVLDLSSNLINGSLPQDFAGQNLHYLNLSNNRISEAIPPEFAKRIPSKATIDLSFNNLTGEVPDSAALTADSLSGNLHLCGKPLEKPCIISSTLSNPPNVSAPTYTPAIAGIPKTIESSPVTGSPGNETAQEGKSKLRAGSIAGIIVGDLAGVGLLALIILYVLRLKKKNSGEAKMTKHKKGDKEVLSSGLCFARKAFGDGETSETTTSDTEEEVEEKKQEKKRVGSLVTVDGETELELETLLKASAYIIGATGTSIVYKAVLEDGNTLAVRRIGENGVERFRDFVNQVRVVAKLRHPNLVQIRGYYWGDDEKLVIYEYVPNGSLVNASYKRAGSSPYQLPWEARLKIARGVARGLAYLHEKKHVHGNLKPSNILLDQHMEPKISDFGLERLVWGENSYKAGGSSRHFGSKRFTFARDNPHALPTCATPSPGSLSISNGSAYHAPESLKNLKPNSKWDVYSFGIVLLELLTGKIFSDAELSHWNTGFVVEERNRFLRMADVAIRSDMEGREDMLVTCFKLGFSCASLVPQKRPSMREVLQVLEKVLSLAHTL
ncbi:hypothetical protein IFM89_029153 [Coptis chinensis]|uniref:non-specific serine/threonine protein kinase n=1 Tax=Coptis chinensis TaxID=261450 RepID=A0A835IS05_9MAGN|nr:hypothetical protein IFM89_029153 [Coptis chinensis]